MTQSATSGVLNRLRTYFEDDLLTQVGRKMRPTPLAEELREPVRDVLMKIQTSIARRPVDEPATSKRHFRIMASDYVINVMLKDALQAVHLQAPNMTLSFSRRTPSPPACSTAASWISSWRRSVLWPPTIPPKRCLTKSLSAWPGRTIPTPARR
jgi:DNA-binding transcriptional LysR family regulator